jgi:hypothetical protein
MKKLLKYLPFACMGMTLPLAAQVTELPAAFDTTIDFWGGLANFSNAANKQGWANNSGIAPNATEVHLSTQMMSHVGMVIRFDVSSVTPAQVNAPGFQATLDVMFHGFGADNNVYSSTGASTPPQYAGHAGDGVTYLGIYRMLSPVAADSNRYLRHSTTGSFENWDNTVPTSAAQAVAESGNFNPALYGTTPEDIITFTHGWDSAVPGATLPNLYGQLQWDLTSLVQDWVNGAVANEGVFLTTMIDQSYGEQVNFLTMETDNRPADGIVAAGDAAPMLRMQVIPEPSTYAAIAAAMAFGLVLLRRRRTPARA